MVAAVLFFGLLGSAVCSAQSLIAGRSEAAASSVFITLTPVMFGALAGLGGYAIYEYMSSLTFHSGDRHISAVMALAFLFGCLGQRLLAHLAGGRKRKIARQTRITSCSLSAMRLAISFIFSATTDS